MTQWEGRDERIHSENSRFRRSMTGADCRSAAFGCGGSIPSLPTRFISNDGPNGPSFRFQPMRAEEGSAKLFQRMQRASADCGPSQRTELLALTNAASD
jgi:hypothetical protein